ncbi:MAG TPA: ferritin-like domain-containing protein [Solirubrobacteraceae bacterium]|jgi:hypothetical protein|nr:ferritin-like domain-containing protein [Solirubrobacteraceae bacterium]
MPAGDDEAYFSFATVAERASRDLYRASYARKGFTALERRHLHAVATAKRAHIMRLDAVLGADAPLSGDFVTVLPKGGLTTRPRILALAAKLETLLVRVYLSGVGAVSDPASRLLLGRLLTYDAQALTWLQVAAGHPSPSGLEGPIDLERAAAQLDKYLSTPDSPD